MILALLSRARSASAFRSTLPFRSVASNPFGGIKGRERWIHGLNSLLPESALKMGHSRRFSTRYPAVDGLLQNDEQEDEEDVLIAEEMFFDGDHTTISTGPLRDNNAENQDVASPFEVTAPFEPQGDQPQAIDQLLKQLREKDRFSVLQGITGTGRF